MRNRKATEREQLVYELGLLFSPIRSICGQSPPPRKADVRVAIAKIQAGDRDWRKSVAAFTTLAPDVTLQHEFQDISHVPERLWQRLKPVVEDPHHRDGQQELQDAIKLELAGATDSFFALGGPRAAGLGAHDFRRQHTLHVVPSGNRMYGGRAIASPLL